MMIWLNDAVGARACLQAISCVVEPLAHGALPEAARVLAHSWIFDRY
jgi:hypothetical protein